MLDVRNSALGLQSHDQLLQGDVEVDDGLPSHLIRPIQITTEKTTISLQDMIDMTVALKSNLDVEIIHPVSQWPHSLFALPSRLSSGENSESKEVPSHIAQIISGLQRELLLLRNELNFELWLSRENVQHIGRLYQDRIVAKSAEAERQGLVPTLLDCHSLFSRRASCSTTNFAITERKWSHSKRNCGITSNKHHRRKTSMRNGTMSFKRN